jgi:hypothetical protein
MMGIDPSHPFYAVAWRRYAIVSVCLIWSGIELYFGNPFWAILSGAVGTYAFWVLIFTFGKKPKEGA